MPGPCFLPIIFSSKNKRIIKIVCSSIDFSDEFSNIKYIDVDDITLDDSIYFFEMQGSAEDPVIYEEEETSPYEINYNHHIYSESLKNIKVVYSGKNGKVNGTLADMLWDRWSDCDYFCRE